MTFKFGNTYDKDKIEWIDLTHNTNEVMDMINQMISQSIPQYHPQSQFIRMMNDVFDSIEQNEQL